MVQQEKSVDQQSLTLGLILLETVQGHMKYNGKPSYSFEGPAVWTKKGDQPTVCGCHAPSATQPVLHALI